MASKKRGLGKGLSALLSDKPSIENLISEKEKQGEKIEYISLEAIKAKEDQPRREFEEDSLRELANSIEVHGVIQPILLRKKDDMYEIIAGERRYRASKIAKLKAIPSIILDAKDIDVAKLALIENIQRENLNPIEEAEAYKKLMEDFDLRQDELGKTIGKSRSYISNTLRLLKLDEKVIDQLYRGELTEGHGKVLLGIKDKEEQVKLAKLIIDTGLNVRKTEDEVKRVKNKKKGRTSDKRDPYLIDLEDQLIRTLGTKVNLKMGDKKGKIEIEYYSNEDLERIFDILTQ